MIVSLQWMFPMCIPLSRRAWSTPQRPSGSGTSWTACWSTVGPSCWSGTPALGSLFWSGTNWDPWTQRNTPSKMFPLTITPRLQCCKVDSSHLYLTSTIINTFGTQTVTLIFPTELYNTLTELYRTFVRVFKLLLWIINLTQHRPVLLSTSGWYVL